MANRDRANCETNNLPRSTERGDKLSASQLNKLANSILRLVQGDSKTIAVNYVGGKAVVSLLQKQIIPRGGGGAFRIYDTLSDTAPCPSLALVDEKGYMKVRPGSGADKWDCFTAIGPTS